MNVHEVVRTFRSDFWRLRFEVLSWHLKCDPRKAQIDIFSSHSSPNAHSYFSSYLPASPPASSNTHTSHSYRWRICCSDYFLTYLSETSWCSQSASNCNNCNSNWVIPQGQCIRRWDGCENDTIRCYSPGQCMQWYSTMGSTFNASEMEIIVSARRSNQTRV